LRARALLPRPPLTPHLRDLAALMVAPQDGHPPREPHFQGDQQRDRLDRVVAPVDVVAHEQVICVGGGPADAEEFEEVLELGCGVGCVGCGVWGVSGVSAWSVGTAEN